GTAPGSDPANDPIGGLVFGYNAFSDIQSAINQVAAGGTVAVYGGTYTTPATLDLNKAPAAIAAPVNPVIPAEATVAVNEAVTLSQNATFVETGVGAGAVAANLAFGSKVDAATPGGAGLTVNGSTVQTFAGAVGGTAALAFFSTDAGGTTA